MSIHNSYIIIDKMIIFHPNYNNLLDETILLLVNNCFAIGAGVSLHITFSILTYFV